MRTNCIIGFIIADNLPKMYNIFGKIPLGLSEELFSCAVTFVENI
jgi:hypothetical protein